MRILTRVSVCLYERVTNNSLICKLLEDFFFRKSTSKDGIKRKSVLVGTDADIPLYIFPFRFIFLAFLSQ